MKQDRLNYLFRKYVAKQCSPAEVDEFMNYVKEEEHTAELISIFDSYWSESTSVELSQGKANEILSSIVGEKKKIQPLRPAKGFKSWMGWAAAIVVVATIAIFIKNPTSPNQVSAVKKNVAPRTDSSVPMLTVVTSNEHKKVNLPDGSTVILNNNSSVSFPKTFTSERKVVLSGEGYFDIKHHHHQSFTVYTGKIRTTVLGTAFNIKTTNNNQNVEVTVTRGKVAVIDSNGKQGVLTPNQQISLNSKWKENRIHTVVAKSIVQWQESDLFFDDISMEEATKILSEKFNTPITFTNDNAKKCRFTATFLNGESLDEILKVMCSFNNANYQTGSKGIIISGTGCEQ